MQPQMIADYECVVGEGPLWHPQREALFWFDIVDARRLSWLAARQQDIVFLPGVMTPSEVMAAVNRGHREMKLFPAAVAGGIAMLRALRGPFADARFCPTGGVDAGNFGQYLALPNVFAVGGSWLAPEDAVRARDWERISALAAKASAEVARSARPASFSRRPDRS